MRIIHTSENGIWPDLHSGDQLTLYISVVLVIIGFEHSSNLAAAYGIAVTGTMVRPAFWSPGGDQQRALNRFLAIGIVTILLIIDADVLRQRPEAVLWRLVAADLALVMFIIMMTTWKSERFRLLRRLHEHGTRWRR